MLINQPNNIAGSYLDENTFLKDRSEAGMCQNDLQKWLEVPKPTQT